MLTQINRTSQAYLAAASSLAISGDGPCSIAGACACGLMSGVARAKSTRTQSVGTEVTMSHSSSSKGEEMMNERRWRGI